MAKDVAEERQQQRDQVSVVIQTTLQSLKPEAKELLQLYYEQQWTQQAIADQMSISQAKVCRQLS